MSLIHTCELNGINPFEYLIALLQHVEELKQMPSAWMPWNYREALARLQVLRSMIERLTGKDPLRPGRSHLKYR